METWARRAAVLFSEFFGWWFGELWGLVPPALRRAFDRRRQRIVLLLGAAEASLQVENEQACLLLGRFALGDEAAAARALAALIEGGGLAQPLRDGAAETCLRLPGDGSLSTQIKLPIAARSNLDEVVEFELERFTPFRPDQVRFAARIAGENAETGVLDVEVVLIPRTAADAAVALAQRLGFSPTRVDIAAPPGGGGASSGNLLRSARERMWQRADRRVVTALLAAAAGLALVAAGLPLVLAQRAEGALGDRFALVKQQALQAATLEKQIDRLRRTDLFLQDRRRTTPTASQVLFDTTHVLPDDTSLSSWQLVGDEIQIQGITRSAAALVNVLEHSRLFDHSRFLSPVTQDPIGGERFNIAAHIMSRKAR